MDDLSYLQIALLSFQLLKNLLRVDSMSVLLGLDLATAIETSPWTCHDFHIIILTLPSLNVPDDILYVPESISRCEFEKHLAFIRWMCEDNLAQVLVLALDIFEGLLGINRDAKDLSRTPSKNVLKVPI
jgi:hypothetical protein